MLYNAQTEIVEFTGNKIAFPDFAGEVSEYNPRGARSFNIVLSDEEAQELSALGYNVRFPKSDQDFQPTVSVTVSAAHDYIRPQVSMFMIMDGQPPVKLDNNDLQSVDALDSYQGMFTGCDCTCTTYNWEYARKTGKKLYLRTAGFYIRPVSDELSDKFMSMMPTDADNISEPDMQF